MSNPVIELFKRVFGKPKPDKCEYCDGPILQVCERIDGKLFCCGACLVRYGRENDWNE